MAILLRHLETASHKLLFQANWLYQMSVNQILFSNSGSGNLLFQYSLPLSTDVLSKVRASGLNHRLYRISPFIPLD